HDRRRRHREVRAVMLADAEHVEPDLVGQLDLLEQVAQPVGGRGLARRQRPERVDAELHDACSVNYTHRAQSRPTAVAASSSPRSCAGAMSARRSTAPVTAAAIAKRAPTKNATW